MTSTELLVPVLYLYLLAFTRFSPGLHLPALVPACIYLLAFIADTENEDL